MPREVVAGFLLTSELIPAYGEAVLTEAEVVDLFAQYQARPTSLLLDHDERTPSSARVLTTELRRTEAGDLGIFVEVEVDTEQLGERGGFSIGLLKSDYDPGPDDGRPQVIFGADAGHFTAEERNAAVDVLRREFRVGGGRYYQFGELPPEAVILNFVVATLMAVPANVLADIIVEALKHLLPNRVRRHTTRFKFGIERGPHGYKVIGVIETDSEAMLRAAAETLHGLAYQEAGVYEFRDGAWRISGATPSRSIAPADSEAARLRMEALGLEYRAIVDARVSEEVGSRQAMSVIGTVGIGVIAAAAVLRSPEALVLLSTTMGLGGLWVVLQRVQIIRLLTYQSVVEDDINALSGAQGRLVAWGHANSQNPKDVRKNAGRYGDHTNWGELLTLGLLLFAVATVFGVAIITYSPMLGEVLLVPDWPVRIGRGVLVAMYVAMNFLIGAMAARAWANLPHDIAGDTRQFRKLRYEEKHEVNGEGAPVPESGHSDAAVGG